MTKLDQLKSERSIFYFGPSQMQIIPAKATMSSGVLRISRCELDTLSVDRHVKQRCNHPSTWRDMY